MSSHLCASCSHADDEHEDYQQCMAPGCGCLYFEPMEEKP